MRFAFCWVLGRGLFLASGEAVEIDRVLSERIGALRRIKFSEALDVLYLTTSGSNQLPDFGPGEGFGSDWQGLFLFPSLPGIFIEEILAF